MTEHKYTDDEIIKALELCSKLDLSFEECDKCPYKGECGTKDGNMPADALALINRQKASLQEVITLNNKLEAENAKLQRLLDFYEETSGNKKAKAEAIKEFAQRLKEKMYPYNGLDKRTYAINARAVEKLLRIL